MWHPFKICDRQGSLQSVFYRIHFGECAKELRELIPPSTFRHRDTRRGRSLRRHVVDMSPCPTSRFGSSFLRRTAKEWNALPANVIPDQFNLDVFKTSANRLFLDRHAPFSTTSSLNIRWDRGQIPVHYWTKQTIRDREDALVSCIYPNLSWTVSVRGKAE